MYKSTILNRYIEIFIAAPFFRGSAKNIFMTDNRLIGSLLRVDDVRTENYEAFLKMRTQNAVMSSLATCPSKRRAFSKILSASDFGLRAR